MEDFSETADSTGARTVSVRLSSAQAEKLDKLAVERNCTISNVIRDLLDVACQKAGPVHAVLPANTDPRPAADEGSFGNTGGQRIKTFYMCLAAATPDLSSTQLISVVFEDEREAAAYVKQHPMPRRSRSTGEEYWPVPVYFAADKKLEALTAKTGLRPATDVRKEIDTTLSEEDLKDLADIAKMIEMKKYEGVKEVVQRSVRVYNELLKAGYMVDKTAGNAEGPGFWTIRW